MFVIAVYVTSRYKNYPEFKALMDEAIRKYIPTGKPNALSTGSSKSNDAGNGLVRRYAFDMGIPCRVFETQWERHIPSKPGKKNTAGVRANAMIVRNSNAAIMMYTPTSIRKWDFMSGGCYNFRKMCGKLKRELIPIKVDIYKPLEKEMPLDAATAAPQPPAAAPNDAIGNIGSATRASDMLPSGMMSASAPPAPATSRTMPHGSPVEMPVDTTGDGVPDATVTAMDLNGDGVPDATVTPVDTNNDGTADDVDVTPLPTAAQSVPQKAQTAAPQQGTQPSEPDEREAAQPAV